jgi:hypothetical protein
MDITADFNVCLKQKGAQPITKKSYDLKTINSFLQEAYEIVCALTKSVKRHRDTDS